MKKGFTLIELVAVITILALISMLGYSYITQNVNSKKEEISDAMNRIISQAASLYIDYNEYSYPKIDNNVYCIKIKELTDSSILTSPVLDPITNTEISLDKYVKVDVNVDKYLYTVVDTCTERK